MTVKAPKNKNGHLPLGLPDLAWYRDAANRRKRNAHIENLCAQIAREFHPEKIILYPATDSRQAALREQILYSCV